MSWQQELEETSGDIESAVRKQRMTDATVQPLFHSLQDPIPGMVPPSFKVDPPASVDLI